MTLDVYRGRKTTTQQQQINDLNSKRKLAAAIEEIENFELLWTHYMSDSIKQAFFCIF